MAVWGVTIRGNPATFVAPDQPNSPPGTVYADPGDAVFWNNTTQQDHKISLLPGEPMTPGHQSDAFKVPNAPNTTIDYYCTVHTSETGKIIVTQKK